MQCLDCKKSYNKDCNKELIKIFANTYEFCNGDINKFVSLIRKGVYPYEYKDNWERFDETSLPHKKAFYSEFRLKDITDKEYTHAQKVFDELKLKNLGDYHDLYVQSDTLLVPDIFENFRNKCIETEKGTRSRICHAIHRYAKANNKYMKNYDKNIESSYLMYLGANNLYGWAMFQKLPVNCFKWVKKLSKSDECFIKDYDENSNKGYFLEVDVEYPKKLFNLHSDFTIFT